MRRKILITVLVAALGAGSLSGCGLARNGADEEASPDLVAALTPEAAALASLGFAPEEVATGDPVAADEPDQADGERWRNWRARQFRR